MTDTPITANRKPADRLAELREQIHTLEAEEAELRAGFIAGTLPLEGDDYVVVVEHKVNQRLDLRAMRQHVAEQVWRPFLLEQESNYVTVKQRWAQPSSRSRSPDDAHISAVK